ncbi:hypothetical protein BJ741DRAFT_705098 [Chytriomyces cf. hyalinus JEL632]|nr:hypothetical protein BJ741DRAFT_705098 [Chytriomyces cf. hyalinus JEL632]
MAPSTTKQDTLRTEPAVQKLSLPCPPVAQHAHTTFAGPGGIELLNVAAPHSPELIPSDPGNIARNIGSRSSEETVLPAACEADELQTSKSTCPRILNPKLGVYKCTAKGCDKEYTKPSLLKQHAYIHTLSRPHNCNYCDSAFARNHDKIRHEKTVHGIQKRVLCKHCGSSFTRKDSCAYHETTSCAVFLGSVAASVS